MALLNLTFGTPFCNSGQAYVPLTWDMTGHANAKIRYRDHTISGADTDLGPPTIFTTGSANFPYIPGHKYLFVILDNDDNSLISFVGDSNPSNPDNWQSSASDPCVIQSATPTLNTPASGATSLSGSGGVNGATLTIYNGATQVHSQILTATGAFTTVGFTPIAGTTYTAKQTESGKTISASSNAVTVPAAAVSATVTLNTPVSGATSLSGSGGVNGSTLKIYSGATLVHTQAITATGAFTTVGFTPVVGTAYTATQTEPSKTESAQSNAVTVPAAAVSATPTLNTPASGATSLSGSGGVNGATLTIYIGATQVHSQLLTATGAFNTVGFTPIAGTTYTAKQTEPSKTISASSNAVTVPAAASVSATPTLNTPATGATSLSGSGGVNGATLKIYSGATVVHTQALTATGAFTTVGFTPIAATSYTATQTEPSKTESAQSNAVAVPSTVVTSTSYTPTVIYGGGGNSNPTDSTPEPIVTASSGFNWSSYLPYIVTGIVFLVFVALFSYLYNREGN